jgi:hypothetical protein
MRSTKEAARSSVNVPPQEAGASAEASLLRDRPCAQRGWPRWIGLAARGLGALSVLSVGAVHLQQYLWLYSAIPTIGTLFVLNFVAATIIGLTLLAPVERWAGRWGSPLLVLVTLGGIALAAVTFALLLVSENTPLFGFQEPGYDPAAIAASRGAEIAAVFFLGAYLASLYMPRTRRQRLPHHDGSEPHGSIEHPDKELSA